MTTDPDALELVRRLKKAVEFWGQTNPTAILMMECIKRLTPPAEARREVAREIQERCAKIADAQADFWIEAKTKLRPIEEVLDAHDSFFNYIENAKAIAKAIRAADMLEK